VSTPSPYILTVIFTAGITLEDLRIHFGPARPGQLEQQLWHSILIQFR